MSREARKHSEQLFYSFVEHSADAIIIFALDGTIMYANPSTTRITGYAASELEGMNTLALIHPNDKQYVSHCLTNLSEQAETPVPLKYRLGHHDGTWRLVEGTATHLPCDSSAAAIAYTFLDVTQQHQLELQLQDAERKLRSLVESNIVGMMVTDEAGHMYEVNDWMAQSLGYSREELLSGQIRVRDLLVPEYHGARARAWKTLISQGSSLPEEKIYIRKDGSRLPMLVAATTINQERSRAMVVCLDISDRKATEQRRQEFLSMVNHELRTPLTVIEGFLDLARFYIERLSRTSVGENDDLHKLDALLQQAIQQVEIESRLVTELLDISRMEMQKFSLSLQRCDMIALVQQVVANQQQMASTRRIELTLPSRAEVPVVADANRIAQVVNNYLSNALKYSPPDRPILVSIRTEGIMVRVSVHDQGPGLTSEQQQRIWERFYQVGATTRYSDTFEGLGLGLYIVRTIIAQHQGQVGVESNPGQGSTFWFMLPLSDEQDDACETQYVMGGDVDSAFHIS